MILEQNADMKGSFPGMCFGGYCGGASECVVCHVSKECEKSTMRIQEQEFREEFARLARLTRTKRG